MSLKKAVYDVVNYVLNFILNIRITQTGNANLFHYTSYSVFTVISIFANCLNDGSKDNDAYYKANGTDTFGPLNTLNTT